MDTKTSPGECVHGHEHGHGNCVNIAPSSLRLRMTPAEVEHLGSVIDEMRSVSRPFARVIADYDETEQVKKEKTEEEEKPAVSPAAPAADGEPAKPKIPKEVSDTFPVQMRCFFIAAALLMGGIAFAAFAMSTMNTAVAQEHRQDIRLLQIHDRAAQYDIKELKSLVENQALLLNMTSNLLKNSQAALERTRSKSCDMCRQLLAMKELFGGDTEEESCDSVCYCTGKRPEIDLDWEALGRNPWRSAFHPWDYTNHFMPGKAKADAAAGAA